MLRQSREKSGTGIYQMIIRTVPLITECGYDVERDTLLPKLMSGEVKVNEIEI